MQRLPRNLHLVTSAQRWQCDWQKTGNTKRLMCWACHAKWHRRSPKCCAWHGNSKSSSESNAKVVRLPHRTIFDPFADTWKCQDAPRLPRKTASQPVLKPSTRRGFAASPRRQRDGTKKASDSRRDMLEHQNEHFVRDLLTFHTSQLQNRCFPTSFLMDLPQTRSFVRGFRRFSSHVTKCHACHGICADAVDPRSRLTPLGYRPLYGLFCAMRHDSRALWWFWAKRGYGRIVHGCKHA